jgi:1-deoxy-D-xylulose-5-phosphate synthase
MSVEIAERLKDQGIATTVIDPRWVMPVREAVIRAARQAGHVAVVEDGIRNGGIGSSITLALQDAGVDTPVRSFGVPRRFLDHAKRDQILESIGLTAQHVSRSVVEWVAAEPITQEATQPPVPGSVDQ